ncbi:helical hairpin domain-containing protein [Falseniella ignava]
MIKEKIAKMATLLELDVLNQSYVKVKDELVHELAESEMRIHELKERVTTSNQVAEYLMASVENKQQMILNLSKLNITVEVNSGIVEKKLKQLGNQLELESDRYKKVVFKVDKFINRSSKGNSEGDGMDF